MHLILSDGHETFDAANPPQLPAMKAFHPVESVRYRFARELPVNAIAVTGVENVIGVVRPR